MLPATVMGAVAQGSSTPKSFSRSFITGGVAVSTTVTSLPAPALGVTVSKVLEVPPSPEERLASTYITLGISPDKLATSLARESSQ